MNDPTRWGSLILFIGFMVGILYFAFHQALPVTYIVGISTIGVATIIAMATVKKGEVHD